ncbi:FAD-dependent oxidoreductase, partial [Halomonas salina]
MTEAPVKEDDSVKEEASGMNRDATPVGEAIIVGGGMVGATLACLLGEAGVAVTLVDARPAPLDAEAVGRGRPERRVS